MRFQKPEKGGKEKYFHKAVEAQGCESQRQVKLAKACFKSGFRRSGHEDGRLLIYTGTD